MYTRIVYEHTYKLANHQHLHDSITASEASAFMQVLSSRRSRIVRLPMEAARRMFIKASGTMLHCSGH